MDQHCIALRGFFLIAKITNLFILNLYSITRRLEDMQNVREMMVNYDELSNKLLDEFVF